MNSRAIFIGVMVLVILPLSLMIGQWSATDPMMAGAAMAVIIIIGVVAVMQQSIWLLIPLFYAFNYPVTFLPGGFSLRDIVTMGVAIVMFVIYVTKRYEIRLKMGGLEVMLLLQMLFLGQAYLRNPVGLAIFGSSSVGGRPYVELLISLSVFIVLSSMVVDFRKVKQACMFYLCGGLLASGLEIIAGLFPRVGLLITKVYYLGGSAGVLHSIGIEQGAVQANVNSVGRKEYLSWLVKPLFAWLVAITRPIGLMNPKRPLIVLGFIIVMLAAMMSGFRSLLLWIVMMYIAASLVRRHAIDVFAASLAGILLISILIVGNGNVFDLPLPVQRSLSFLPGDWNALAEGDANSSAEWRFEMWEEVMTTDTFIENKFVGDGFGFSSDDLDFMAQLYTQGTRTPAMMQEHFMRSGEYHSGPIQVINRVGYFGLLMLTIGMIVYAKYAWRMIRRTAGSSYYIYAIFIGLPMIVYPFYFYIVIGGYQEAIGLMTFGGGMLRMIENSINKYGVES